MQVGSLFVALGFKVDDEKLKSFKDGISNVQKEMFKLSAVAAGAVYSINRFLNQGVQSSVALRNYAVQTGAVTDELERFANVAERANTTLTLDQVIASFREVGTVLDEIRRKGNYPTGALWMGLGNLSEIRDPADLVKKIYADMPNIMRRLHGNRTAFSNELATIGLSGFENMFFLSPEKFQEYWRKAIPTKEQREAMERIAVAYKNFTKEFDMFRIRMGARIEPYWVKAIDMAIPILTEFTGNIISLGESLYKVFADMPDWASWPIFAFLAAISVRLFPLTALVLALVAGLNELGKLSKGEGWLSDKIDKGVLALTTGWQSDPTSLAGGLKRYLADKIYGEGVKSDEELGIRKIDTGVHGLLKPEKSIYERKSENKAQGGNFTYAPTYNTTTNADPYQLMDAIGVYDQNALNRAMQSIGISGSGMVTGGN